MTRLTSFSLLLLIFFVARPGSLLPRTWQSMAVQFPEFGLMSSRRHVHYTSLPASTCLSSPFAN